MDCTCEVKSGELYQVCDRHHEIHKTKCRGCESMKAINPDKWARLHRVSVPIEILKTHFTQKELRAKAKALRLKCYNWMTRAELEEAVDLKSREADPQRIETLIASARVRYKSAWANYNKNQCVS